jgi:hypothetical protein
LIDDSPNLSAKIWTNQGFSPYLIPYQDLPFFLAKPHLASAYSRCGCGCGCGFGFGFGCGCS